MARRDRKPRARGWYVKTGDPPGTERFWDGEKWGPQPRLKRGAAPAEKPSAKRKGTEPAEMEEAIAAPGPAFAMQQSSVWSRISARSADMVILILPWYFTWVRAFSTEESIVDGVATETTVVNQLYVWAAVGVIVLYEVAFVRWWGATPGKRLVGLLIVDRETLAPPGWVRTFLRTTPMVLLAAIVLAPLLWVICVVAMAVDKLQRSAFDLSGGTVVVMDPKRPGRLAKPKGAKKAKGG